MHFINAQPKEENPEHLFFYNGKLYFYNEEDILLGTYTCKNPDGYCGYASASVQGTYALDEYKETSETELGIISNRFVFLKDTKTDELTSSNAILYDLETKMIMNTYKEIKNYGIGINDNYYILKNANDLYGVVAFHDGVNLKLPFQYEYIGLANHKDTETEKIDATAFAVLLNGHWQLIDSNQAQFTSELPDAIVAYNGEYIVLTDTSKMYMMNYDQDILLDNYKYINFYNKYLTIIDMNNQFYLYNFREGMKVSNSYNVNSIEDVTLSTIENKIVLTIQGEEKETIAIS